MVALIYEFQSWIRKVQMEKKCHNQYNHYWDAYAMFLNMDINFTPVAPAFTSRTN